MGDKRWMRRLNIERIINYMDIHRLWHLSNRTVSKGRYRLRGYRRESTVAAHINTDILERREMASHTATTESIDAVETLRTIGVITHRER
jgi:hypothetical protein